MSSDEKSAPEPATETPATAVGTAGPVMQTETISSVNIRRQRHIQMLLLSSGVLLLSFCLQVIPPDRVAFRFARDYVLPETCGSKILFDVSCPGCGLTRSFVYLAQGNLRKSIEMNRIGIVIATAVLLQFPYRILAMRGSRLVPSLSTARWFGNLLIATIIGNWILTFFL